MPKSYTYESIQFLKAQKTYNKSYMYEPPLAAIFRSHPSSSTNYLRTYKWPWHAAGSQFSMPSAQSPFPTYNWCSSFILMTSFISKCLCLLQQQGVALLLTMHKEQIQHLGVVMWSKRLETQKIINKLTIRPWPTRRSGSDPWATPLIDHDS